MPQGQIRSVEPKITPNRTFSAFFLLFVFTYATSLCITLFSLFVIFYCLTDPIASAGLKIGRLNWLFRSFWKLPQSNYPFAFSSFAFTCFFSLPFNGTSYYYFFLFFMEEGALLYLCSFFSSILFSVALGFYFFRFNKSFL
jgi:hypothetical protein